MSFHNFSFSSYLIYKTLHDCQFSLPVEKLLTIRSHFCRNPWDWIGSIIFQQRLELHTSTLKTWVCNNLVQSHYFYSLQYFWRLLGVNATFGRSVQLAKTPTVHLHNYRLCINTTYIWGCLTLSIKKLSFDLLKTLPNSLYLVLGFPSQCLSALDWIIWESFS